MQEKNTAYEIITLPERTVIGLAAQTANTDPKMGEIIGGLWQRLFAEGQFTAIPGAVNPYSIGLYSDYSADKSAYQVTIGRMTDGTGTLPEGMVKKVLPAGRYARFTVHGDMVKAVQEGWQTIWSLPLDRSFTGDYEEYVSDKMEDADIYLYVALNDETR